MATSTIDSHVLGQIGEQVATKIVAALDRNSAALLTLAVMVGKHRSQISAPELPDFIGEEVTTAYHELLGWFRS
jgi:hypothetical protein